MSCGNKSRSYKTDKIANGLNITNQLVPPSPAKSNLLLK